MLRCLFLYSLVVGVYSGCVDDITEPLLSTPSNASTIQFVKESIESPKNARRSLESSVTTESQLRNSAHHAEQRTPSRSIGEMLHDAAPSLSLKSRQPPSNRINNSGTLDLKALDALIKKPSATNPKIEERRQPSAPEFELEEEMEPRRIPLEPKAPEADSEDVFETSTTPVYTETSTNETELESTTNETSSVQLSDQPEVPAEIQQPTAEKEERTTDQMTNKSEVQPEVQEIVQPVTSVNATSFSTAAEIIPDYYVEETSVEDWERAVLSGTYPDPSEAPPPQVEGSGEDQKEEEAYSLTQVETEKRQDEETVEETKSDTVPPAVEQVQKDEGEAVAETEEEPKVAADGSSSSQGEEPAAQEEAQEVEPEVPEEPQQQDVLSEASSFSAAAETIPDYYIEDKSIEDWERAVLSGTYTDPTEMPAVEEGSGEAVIAEQLSQLEQTETTETIETTQETISETETPEDEQNQLDQGEPLQIAEAVQQLGSAAPGHITIFEETLQESEASGVSETTMEESATDLEGSVQIEDSQTFNDVGEVLLDVKSSEETISTGTLADAEQTFEKEEDSWDSDSSKQPGLELDNKNENDEMETRTKIEEGTLEDAVLQDQPSMTSSSDSPKEEEEKEEEEVPPSSSEAPVTENTLVVSINVKSAEAAASNAEQFAEKEAKKNEMSHKNEPLALENIETVTVQIETTTTTEALETVQPLVTEATSTLPTSTPKEEVLQASTDAPIESSTEKVPSRITSTENNVEQKDLGEAIPTTTESETTIQSTTEDLPPSTTEEVTTEEITTETTIESTATVSTTTESTTPTTTTELSTPKKEELKDRAADFVTMWTRRPRKKRCPRATNYREYDGQCYSIWSYEPLQAVSVELAEEACGEARPGAKLVSIHNKEEQQIVTELQHTIPHPHETLIGLRYNSTAFSWSDGTPMHYLHNRLQTKRTSYCVVNDIHCKKDDCSAQWKLVSCNSKYWYFVCKHETF